MNIFGDTLKTLLKNKNIKKSNFAKLIHIQRSTLYKYIDGTTLPDEKLLEDMKENLNLSKYDLSYFDEAYLTSKFGEGVMKNRQTIHCILEDMSHFYNNSLLKQNINFELFTVNSCLPEKLKVLIEKLLSSNDTNYTKILLNTTQTEEVTELLKFIIDKINKISNYITIEHIFHYKNIRNVQESVENLQFFSYLSTVISAYENYNPFFYSITTSHDNYNIFPNTLLIDKTLIYISNDFKNWFYIDEESNSNIDSIITFFHKEFSKSKMQTNPIMRIMRNMSSFQEFIVAIEDKSMTEYAFRRDLTCSCFPSNITIDWFEFDSNSINEDYLKLIIDLHINRTTDFKNKLAEEFKYFCVSSFHSASDFLNKGRIYDQGEYPTFKIKARIKLILNLLHTLCKYDNFEVFLIKDKFTNNLTFIDNIQVCTNDNALMISICDENSEICKKQPFVLALAFESQEISNCFNDYIQSLTRTLTYSKEESILLIKRQLDDFAYKNNLELNYDETILNYIKKLKNIDLR